MTKTTTKPSRTSRVVRNGFPMSVGPGASAQDGDLPLYQCNTCHGEVVWATSSRTGRKYLCNVYQGTVVRYYVKRSVHQCQDRLVPQARNILHDVAMDWQRSASKRNRAVCLGLHAGVLTEAEATAAFGRIDTTMAVATWIDDLDDQAAVDAYGRLKAHWQTEA